MAVDATIASITTSYPILTECRVVEPIHTANRVPCVPVSHTDLITLAGTIAVLVGIQARGLAVACE